jgi:hypothetical protein
VQNDEIRFVGGANRGTVGKVTNLRGTWIRLVVRLKLAGGTAGAVWMNGAKTISLTNRSVLPDTGTSIRLDHSGVAEVFGMERRTVSAIQHRHDVPLRQQRPGM